MTERQVSFPCDLYVIVHLNNSTFSREGKEEIFFGKRKHLDLLQVSTEYYYSISSLF